jgi:hypothetical protein
LSGDGQAASGGSPSGHPLASSTRLCVVPDTFTLTAEVESDITPGLSQRPSPFSSTKRAHEGLSDVQASSGEYPSGQDASRIELSAKITAQEDFIYIVFPKP